MSGLFPNMRQSASSSTSTSQSTDLSKAVQFGSSDKSGALLVGLAVGAVAVFVVVKLARR